MTESQHCPMWPPRYRDFLYLPLGWSNPMTPDNTLRNELGELLYQAHINATPGLDTLDAILSAIKNRLPKVELDISDSTAREEVVVFKAKAELLRDVKQALDIESES